MSRIAFQVIGPPPPQWWRTLPPDDTATVDPAQLAVAIAKAQAAIDSIDRRMRPRIVCACVVCDADLTYPAVVCRSCAEQRAAEEHLGQVEYRTGSIISIR